MLKLDDRSALVEAIRKAVRGPAELQPLVEAVRPGAWATAVPKRWPFETAVRCLVDEADKGDWLPKLVQHFQANFSAVEDFHSIAERIHLAARDYNSCANNDGLDDWATVFIATSWSDAPGNYNSLSSALCRAVALTNPVVCLIPSDCELPQPLPSGPLLKIERVEAPSMAFTRAQPQAINACEHALDELKTKFVAIVGHDVLTGDLSIKLARRYGCVAAILLHSAHTRLDAIGTVPHESIPNPAARQRDLLRRADVCFPVGPAMVSIARDRRPTGSAARIIEFMPGLDEQRVVSNRSWQPMQIGIWEGPEPLSDLRPQCHAGVLYAAYATRRWKEHPGGYAPDTPVTLNVFCSEERSINPSTPKVMVEDAVRLAGRPVDIQCWSSRDPREGAAKCLAQQAALLIPRVEEGFCTIAWQAIEQSLPLILPEGADVARFLAGQELSDLVTLVERGTQPDVANDGLADFIKQTRVPAKGRKCVPLRSINPPATLDRWSTALLRVVRNQDDRNKRAAKLRQTLIERGFGWSKLALSFVQSLINIHRELFPPKLDSIWRAQRSAARANDRPKAGSLAFEALQDFSRRCAERIVPLTDFHTAQSYNQLVLFDHIVLQGGRPLPDAVNALTEKISTAPAGEQFLVCGPEGAGKAQLLACLYRRLSQFNEDPSAGLVQQASARIESPPLRLQPIFLDCTQPDLAALETQIAGLKQPEDIKEFQSHFTGRHPILIIRGDPTSREHRRWPWFEEAAGVRCTRVSGSRPSTSTGRAGRDWDIATPPFSTDLAEAYLRLAANCSGLVRDDCELERANAILQRACWNHRLPLSYGLAEICITRIDSAGDPTTLSKLMLEYCGRHFAVETDRHHQGGAPPREERDAKRKGALDSAAILAHRRYTSKTPQQEHADAQSVVEAYGGVYATILHAHPSVSHWLVATHICESLIGLGYRSLRARCGGTPLKESDERGEICPSLEFVYPSCVDAFVKEILHARVNHRQALEEALRIILTDEAGRTGRILKANACYIVGRLTDNESVTNFSGLLRTVLQQTHSDLNELETYKQCILLAQRRNSPKCVGLLQHSVDSFCKLSPSLDPLVTLERARMESLLLQRSAYISLAELGDARYAHEYVASLLSDTEQDDLNRGFHLEFHGDIPYRPRNPLLSSDTEGLPCPQTINALLAALEDKRRRPSALIVPAVTLASFAHHRHRDGSLSEDHRTAILAYLVDIAEVQELGRPATEFISNVIRVLCRTSPEVPASDPLRAQSAPRTPGETVSFGQARTRKARMR